MITVPSIAPKLRSELARPRRMIELLTHEQVGDVDEVFDTGTAGVLVDNKITATSGTTTNWWATANAFAPSGDQLFRVAGNTDLTAFLGLKERQAAGKDVGIIAEFTYSTDPAGEECFFDAGRNAGAGYSGWELRMANGGVMGASVMLNGAHTGIAGADLTSRIGQRIVFGVYFALQEATPRAYTIVDDDSVTYGGTDLPALTNSINATLGVGFYNRLSGGGTEVAELNSLSSGIVVHSMRIIEFNANEFTVCAAACKEIYENAFLKNLLSLST